MLPADDPFTRDDVVWVPVSPRLALAQRIVSGIGFGVISLVLLVVGTVLGMPLLALAALIPVLLMVWEWWLIGRQTAAITYVERTDDLVIRRGLLFRTVVVVPYGRMQFVDVEAGPLDRKLGIARVRLHTASPGTQANIPGVETDQAALLQDRLSRRGEARLAGL